MELIDKDVLLLKIDSKIEEAQKVFNVAPSSVIGGMIEGYTRIKKIINSLEVKEVDLETEIEEQCKKINQLAVGKELRNICRHFFELGLKAKKPLTWEDMMLIHKCIKDAMNYHLYKMMEGVEGQKVVYQEVLKRFRERKEK